MPLAVTPGLTAFTPPSSPPEEWDAETAAMMARALERSGRYRVVEKLERRARYTDGPCAEPRLGLYLDVETTGTDALVDRVIQLAIVPFTFDAEGRVFDVEPCRSWLEDPGIPIPERVVQLTGLTDDMVRGQRIDEDEAHALLERAGLVIAHKAEFDRAFMERRMPAFANSYWACSMADIPWDAEGFRSRALETLAYQHCRMFYPAHRADEDCYMGIHLLASSLPSGGTALGALLRSARRQEVRVWALTASYESRHALKAHGYHWCTGEHGRPKAWYKDVPEEQGDAELAWLASDVYVNGGVEAARCVKLDRRLRHSDRAGMPAPH